MQNFDLYNSLYGELVQIQEDNIEIKNYLKNTHLILMAYAISARIPAKNLAQTINNAGAIKKYETDLVAELNKLNKNKDKNIEDVIKKYKK